MQCRDFRELADSYLSDELLIETNHDVISHLEGCPDCRREMSARREVRATLRLAFFNAPERTMRKGFADLLHARLRAQAFGRSPTNAWTTWWTSVRRRPLSRLALAASLLVATVIGVIVVRYELRRRSSDPTVVSQKGTSPRGNDRPGARLPVEAVEFELAKSAVGDHENCAIQFRLPETPIPLDEAGVKYDRAYLNLAQAVTSVPGGLPAGAELVEAHSCVFEGRRFAHLVFKYQGRVVSLLLTDNGPGPGPGSDAGKTAAPNQVIACAQIDGYRISCFAAGHHAVFVVSDLPEGENLAFAREVAHMIIPHVVRAEAVT